MSNFPKVLPLTLAYEGGKVDDPRDPGGRTNKGITQKTYDAWRVKQGLPKRDVWLIADSEVAAIYEGSYWKPAGCELMPAGLAFAVFDFAVNSGVKRAVTELQELLNVNADGAFGPKSAAAIPHDTSALIARYCDVRLAFLKSLSVWPTYKNGWSKRVANVKATALQLKG